ncbi:NmrA domain-containing protein [Mycena indigotica]|uniref:NmrA domain-containing protein n=1 Tax=Mycena indigotica TaxID=2126181 RepID=A0A8H6TB62_9AGAR|nr:NmrA domain-containing protein [Mycena indigotica]KAF7315283.1 NmrA domain-containing protein [Mycena indigotica]
MENHPLLIPELLELVLWELHTSRQDLIRCSLVTRAWTFPTQAYLFRSLHLSNRPLYHPIELSPAAANTRLPSPEWKLLASALNSSPHLILHVRRLRITLDLLQPDEQPETGGISFEDAIESLSNSVDAHNAPVEALVLNIANGAGNVSPRYLVALQGLLSVPRLKAVTFSWGRLPAGNLVTLWENSAADIRHLEFIYSPGRGNNLKATPAPEDRDKITLESLSTPRLDEFSLAMGWRFDFKPQDDLFSLDFHAPPAAPEPSAPTKNAKDDIMSLFSSAPPSNPAASPVFGQFQDLEVPQNHQEISGYHPGRCSRQRKSYAAVYTL